MSTDQRKTTEHTLTQQIIDLAYRVICEHSGECEVENLPNEMQCIFDGAARAGEPVFEVCKHHPSCTVSDQDLMWVCAQCGLRVPAHASEQSNDLPGSWQEANKDPLRNEYNA